MDLERFRPQTLLLSDSFEKLSFFRRCVMGLTRHFMSTISTMPCPFLTAFFLTGVPSTDVSEASSIGIRGVPFVWCFLLEFSGFLELPVALLLLASSADVAGFSPLEVSLPLEAEKDAHFVDSSSLDIRALIVPVVPTLIDPPPPLIASNF